MSKLIVYDLNGSVLGERQLDRERIRIGRRAHCDLPLDHISVSGEHALITTFRNDSFLQDLGSTNGVRVNGRLIKNHHLQDGDEINIAVFNLKFQFEPWISSNSTWLPTEVKSDGQDASEAVQAQSSDDATLLEIGSEMDAGLSRLDTNHRMFDAFVVGQGGSGEAGLDARVGMLRLVGGAGAGKQLALDRPALTLGKPGIQTAVIGKKAAGYFLTYVEGATYPLVNGVEVGATPYQLRDHDILELGGTRLEFFYR